MFLNNIAIKNFRSLDSIKLKFDNLLTFFYANNGVGKTNLLESIQLLSLGKTIKSETNALKNLYKESDFLKVSGDVMDDQIIKNLEVLIEFPLNERAKKKLKVNSNLRKPFDYTGVFPSIWFSPENMKLITTSPKNKREYMDRILEQLSKEFYIALRGYNRVLKQRNTLLKSSRFDSNLIKILTEQLISYANIVNYERRAFFNDLNKAFENQKYNHRYSFFIKDIPNILSDNIFEEDFKSIYREKLRDSYQYDLEHGVTKCGCHKDNWEIFIKIDKEFVNAEKYASRGQQRISIIMLQFAFIDLFANKNTKPVLLLDDIFSELDAQNNTLLIDILLENNIQAVITGVDKPTDKRINSLDLLKIIM